MRHFCYVCKSEKKLKVDLKKKVFESRIGKLGVHYTSSECTPEMKLNSI